MEWFSGIIDRILADGPEASFTDYELIDLLVGSLLNINAEQLLPKIKLMYDQNIVNRQGCGYWKDVDHGMKASICHNESRITDIKQTYAELDRAFGRNI